jgi:8-oxo-dGTP pyrophosphatase MutT (NUDIX family)
MIITIDEFAKIFQHQPRRPEPNVRLQHSAVMMILFEREADGAAQTHLVFIMKTSDGSRHGGQIALPGGKVEAGETSAFAALRETQEEIGVLPSQLEVLGSLGYFSTMTTGYDAAVFVARPRAPLQYAPHTGEVAAIFEIPVAVLWEQFDPALHIQTPADMLRLHFHLPAEFYLKFRTPGWPGGRKNICIWGFTARVLQHFFHMKMLLASESTRV